MTSTAVDRIVEALDELLAAGGHRDPAALSPADLIAVGEAYGALKRRVDAAFAPVAAEIARQSRPELGSDSLARKQGFRGAANLLSTATGSSMGDAIKLVQVGEATAPRMSLSGESLPAKHPHVAAALAAGTIGVPASSAIISMLDRVALRADAAALEAMERHLAEAAAGLSLDQLRRLLVRAEAYLDPDGVEPREEQRRGERSLTIQERDGMIHLTGVWDVETGAPIKAAIEGMTTAVLRRRMHGEEQGDGDATTQGDAGGDERSVRQIQADALSDLCRHGLGCEQLPTGATTTVVVRMTLDDLQSGTGAATVDGVDQPISISAARRMAASAQIIPCVLGGESEILDWGRAKRLFTPAQKLALVERDGGCAHCGAPPHWAVVHHIRWWERDQGPTDLDNGVLLCVACHVRLHCDGWDIRVDGTGVDARVWFVPPSWLDRDRVPRLGGRARYGLAC